MNRKLVIFGFGRIGLTHSSQIIGSLDADNLSCHICDSSLFARMVAKSLLPNVKTYSNLDAFRKKVRIQKDDLVVVCTPPNFREEFFELIPNHCRHVLIEKPVGLKLEKGWMSGYVMQHCPLNVDVKQTVGALEIQSIEVSLNTNINSKGLSK